MPASLRNSEFANLTRCSVRPKQLETVGSTCSAQVESLIVCRARVIVPRQAAAMLRWSPGYQRHLDRSLIANDLKGGGALQVRCWWCTLK